jgi:ABC-type dipeptide/oligopeptide/nickel transport system ATPase subunit
MLHTYHAGGLMIVLGERGSGKTEMANHLEVHSKASAGFAVLLGKEKKEKASKNKKEVVEVVVEEEELSAEDEKILERKVFFESWHNVLSGALKLLMKKAKKNSITDKAEKAEAEEAVVMECLVASFGDGGADDPRLAYAPELNAVFGRVVVPAPPGYEPPPEQHRPKETASLAVAILTELAKTEDVLILLHIQTNTDNEKKLPFDAWKIARDVRNAALRAGSRAREARRVGESGRVREAWGTARVGILGRG